METQTREVKKKHPRKNPSPQKLVSVADRELLYPVEIKIEPRDADDGDAQYEYDCSSSGSSRPPASDLPTQRTSRHKHKSGHHRRKHSKERRVGSPLKAKTKSHKGVEKLKHKRGESKRENLDKSKRKVIVEKKNPSQRSHHSGSPLVKSGSVLIKDKNKDSDLKVESEQEPPRPIRRDDTLHSEKVLGQKKEKHSKRRHKRVEELSKLSQDKQKSKVKASERSGRCLKRSKRNEDLNKNPLKKQKCESEAASTVTRDGQNAGTMASTKDDTSPLQVCSSETDKPVSDARDACSKDASSVKSPGQVTEAVTHDEECCDAGIKSTDKTESASDREPSKQQAELNQPQQKSGKTGDNSELNLLTEDLLSLNQDSAHLNTVIHRKPTPKKRRTHSRHGKVHSHVTPLKLLTPRKSPWKTFSLRVTPHRHSTPSSSCQTPRSTPGSTSGSIPDLHTPKSTPRSAKSERKFQIVKRTPSKVSIKRRLYAAMKSPEKIIDENEDVTNLSFPDITSPESDGIQRCSFEDSPEKIHIKTPKGSAKKRSSSSVKFNLSATEQEEDGASSCSEKLNIMSDLDEDPLDQILEEKSKKVQHVHLTAKNVRSIIHQVITNEHVLDMVRNTLKEDGLGDQLKEAIFEPRLTRSMVKEAIQKGTIPLPWSFSPIKVLKEEMIKPGPQFLEMKFSDSEDNDEEYQPSPEELEHADDDEESICSQASDFGSPFPSCVAMSSPCVSKSDIQSDADNTTTTSNMGPPVVTQVLGSKHIKNHSDGTQKVGVDDTQDMTEEEMMIAKRTRSKLPLTDTPLEVIESEFVAPDITPDMYDTHCDDTEWQEFLAGLMKSQDLNDTCDEAEDPEYNFLADDEVDIVDDEDFRNDKAVNIPKKEVDELMSELFEAYSGTIVGDENMQDSGGDVATPGHENPQSVPSNGDEPEPNVPSSPETPADKHQSASSSGYPGWLPPLQLNPHMASIVASDIMRIKHNTDLISSVPKLTELELIQLQDQMRKHVQLLAQTFVQCGASDDELLKSTQNTARSLLLELRVLGEVAELKKGHSYMKPPNLTEAIQITELDLKSDNPEAEELLSKNLSSLLPPKKACEHPLTYKQMDVLVSSPVFVFPQMLPDYALVTDSRCKKRVAFTHAEDNLLAMGFDQFHQLEKRYLYIHKFLLPTKQREQIRFRHKNLRSRHNRQDKCALNYWYENGHLPEFQRYFELEEVGDIKAPKYRDPELLPAWFQAYLSTKQQLEPEIMDADSGVLATADDHSSPSSGSSSSCVKNFKRETKKGHSVKKPVAKKLTYDRLKPIATKPPASGQPNSTVITISSAVSAQSQDSDISQQVLDTLMSAITDESTSGVGSTVTANASSMLPLVTVASDNQQVQPVVMLTTSQLEQLGIKVNVIDSPNTGLGTTASNGQQCVLASADHSTICQNVAISNAPTEPEEGLNISSQSLISHAFSEATGIPLDSLQSETEIITKNPSSNEVVSPVVLSDVLMKEDNINPNIGSTAERNSDNKDGTEGRIKGSNPTEDLNSKQNDSDNKNISQVNANPRNPLSAASQVSEQDSSEACSSAEPTRTVHHQSDGEPGEQSCDGGVSELDSDNVNEVAGSPKTSGGCDGGDGTERQGKSPEPLSVCKDVNAKHQDSVVQGSCGTGSTDDSVSTSPNSSQRAPIQVDDSPIKHTIHVMAELAQLISTPTKVSPLKLPHQHRASFMTPRKQSPRKSTLKPLRPLGSVNPSPVKLNLPKKSVIGRPRRYNHSQNRKNFNKKAQSIAPKGFILQSYVSPVKLAAANISAKARKKSHSKPKAVHVLRALLPKSGTKVTSDPEDDFSTIDNNENHGFCGFRDQLHREAKLDQDADGFSETEAGNESQPDEEQMDEEGEDEADRDEDRLAQLMAASTTVRSVAKKSAIGDQKRKKMYKRAALLELLEPDLVDNDPRRDERDTAFAQGYLVKVQQALSDQPEHYEKFLKLLYEFGCSDKTPVELYFSIKDLLKDHPILLSDFAGFLMPDQAKVCGCLMEHINFKRCREFLRKLEIHFSKQPHTLQRVIKAFAQWQNSSHSDPSDLMATVKPLLKGQPYLLDEFTKFFDYEKPPESSRTEFEEVILPDDSDEEQPEFDGYEEVQFPDGDDDDELYGTKLCRCRCHDNNELKFARRRVHCRSCAVRVVRGHVYLQSSERDLYILQPSVIHHSPSDDTADAEPNSAGDEDMTENPPDANNKQKTSSKKIKVKLHSVKKSQGSSLEKMPPNSEVNSLDGFAGQGDTVCEDGRRLSDVSESVSLHVLSCGEEAILSPDGATCQLTNSSTSQVIGPTDFSHMSQEFRKCNNNEKEQTESDCIAKDSNCDMNALHTKMEGEDGTDLKCDDSEAGNSQKPHESATRDTCNPNLVKSDSDNEEEQNMELEYNDIDNSSTDANMCRMGSMVPHDRQDSDDVDASSDHSSADSDTAPEESAVTWSREDDRLILETCRRDGTGDEVFQNLARTLDKTSEQVLQRFIMMINLLAEDEEGTEASEGEGEE